MPAAASLFGVWILVGVKAHARYGPYNVEWKRVRGAVSPVVVRISVQARRRRRGHRESPGQGALFLRCAGAGASGGMPAPMCALPCHAGVHGLILCCQGSSVPQLCGRFNAPPPGSEAAHGNAAAGAGVVGNSDEDSKSDRSPYQPSCTSIALGGRKFHVTSSDHCDLLAIAGGAVQVGLILAAVPFGTLVVLFRCVHAAVPDATYAYVCSLRHMVCPPVRSPRLSAAPVRRVVRTFTDSLRGVALASA